MCGIVGQLNQTNPIQKKVFNQMRDALYHRGPDGADSQYLKRSKVALGHRRLSFLDLSELGKQPMSNEDNSIWLVFNGEIYNYIELKVELEQNGHRFKSNSDTEVLIHGYEEWGAHLLQRLKGMYAFGLWDDKKNQLFLARDRFGIKPLYYAALNDSFFFASELKGIVTNPDVARVVDPTAICDFLVYRYVPSPKTIWKGIEKLPPANYLIYDFEKNEIIEKKEYWSLTANKKVLPEKEVIQKVDELLSKSVEIHVRSDVLVGSFLSGGYDSSALVYYLSRLPYLTNTFSIGFDNWKESEHNYAEVVSNKFDMPLQTKIVDDKDLELVKTLMYYYDEPIADISIIPTYMVSEIASQSNKAVLSGEGADEIFCGYWWQKDIQNGDWQTVKIGNRLRDRIKHFFVKPKPTPLLEKYAEAMAMGRWTQDNLNEILHPNLEEAIPENSEWFYKQHLNYNTSHLKAFQFLDIKTFMAELVLVKVDRASMANSLEVRVPFLDHELFEYLYALDESIYYKEGITKHLLYENIKKVMPAQILKRSKQGFVGPDEYYTNIEYYAQKLEGGRLIKEKIIQESGLKKLIEEKDHWRLWKLFVLEMWWQNWC